MKAKHILFLILSVSVLASCVQRELRKHHQAPVRPWTITLRVTGNGAGASMDVSTIPMPGCGSTVNGCMVFSNDEIGEITFDMSGNDGGFHITQLKICKGATPPVDLDADCDLGVNALDFYVLDSSSLPIIPNPSTGKIEWPFSDAVKSFVLFDRNLLEQEYYYLAIACDGPDPETDNCILADPPLDNKGVN